MTPPQEPVPKDSNHVFTVADTLRRVSSLRADAVEDDHSVANNAETDQWVEEQSLRDMERSAVLISSRLQAGRTSSSVTPASTPLTPDSPTYLLPYDPAETREQFNSPVLEGVGQSVPATHNRNISATSGNSNAQSGRRVSRISLTSESSSRDINKSKSRIEALLDDCDKVAEQRRASRLSNQDGDYSIDKMDRSSSASNQIDLLGGEPNVEAGMNGVLTAQSSSSSFTPLSARTNRQVARNGVTHESTQQVIIDDTKKRGPSALELLEMKYGRE